jgi:hypothetical protein
MEELTYHSGTMRVGKTSENFAEPITNVCARTLAAEKIGTATLFPTSPSLLTRTNGTHDLTFSPSCRFSMRCIETFDSVGIWGVIRMLHELFLPDFLPGFSPRLARETLGLGVAD